MKKTAWFLSGWTRLANGVKPTLRIMLRWSTAYRRHNNLGDLTEEERDAWLRNELTDDEIVTICQSRSFVNESLKP